MSETTTPIQDVELQESAVPQPDTTAIPDSNTTMSVGANKLSFKEQINALHNRAKQLQEDHQQYNEQQKLYDRLHGTIYDGYVHPGLLGAFFGLRPLATPATLGEKREDYFKLMRIETLNGLSYHEMAQVLNFIENISPNEAEKRTEYNVFEWPSILEEIYNDMAIAVWNKTVNVWRDEIAIGKVAIAEEVKRIVDQMNQLQDQLNKKNKKPSRAERKAINAKKQEHGTIVLDIKKTKPEERI